MPETADHDPTTSAPDPPAPPPDAPGADAPASSPNGSGPRRLAQYRKLLDRRTRAANRQNALDRKMETLVEHDRQERIRRDRLRAELVGAWILTEHRDWFADGTRRAAFDAWLRAVPARRGDLRLFKPGADDDLLDDSLVETVHAQVSAAAAPADAAGDGDDADDGDDA